MLYEEFELLNCSGMQLGINHIVALDVCTLGLCNMSFCVMLMSMCFSHEYWCHDVFIVHIVVARTSE